jgi:hypothetical protein
MSIIKTPINPYIDSQEEGITAEATFFILKTRFGIEFSDTNQKASNKLREWVKRGIVDGPLYRKGVEETGGRRGYYSKSLPLEIATIFYMHNAYNLPLEMIGTIRVAANHKKIIPSKYLILNEHLEIWEQSKQKLTAN